MRPFDGYKSLINPKSLKRYADFFRDDSVVLFPTDTVAGVGCRFDSIAGISKIRKVKRIMDRNPLAVLISDEKQLDKLKVRRSQLANLIMSKFWPGALTIVLTAEEAYPCSGEGNTIGLRMPDSDLLRKIINMVGIPLAATSANFHGQTPPARLKDVDDGFITMVDHVIDFDLNSVGLPSTVVRVEGGVLRIFREGAITKDDIGSVVGDKFG
jgi:L-threonylcarbamoyladenylate synthase